MLNTDDTASDDIDDDATVSITEDDEVFTGSVSVKRIPSPNTDDDDDDEGIATEGKSADVEITFKISGDINNCMISSLVTSSAGFKIFPIHYLT